MATSQSRVTPRRLFSEVRTLRLFGEDRQCLVLDKQPLGDQQDGFRADDRRRVPEPHGALGGPGGHGLAVAAEHHLVDRPLEPHERTEGLLFTGGVPEPHLAVPAVGHESALH